jgi:hypothetical protein
MSVPAEIKFKAARNKSIHIILKYNGITLNQKRAKMRNH